MTHEPWHAWAADETLNYWETDGRRGLDDREALERLEHFGDNALEGDPRPPVGRLLLAQFRDLMVLILLAATLISFALGEIIDGAIIAVIIILNGAMGFMYEYRAEQALHALKSLASPGARVVRGGTVAQIPAGRLVPGDVFLLETGDRVPADGRLLESESLELDEAPLTGESGPVTKSPAGVCPADAVVGDRTNMVFKGTAVARGRGRAVVVATGMATEMGRIARLIAGAEDAETPLQRRLGELGRLLVAVCLVVCGLVVVLGLINGESPYTMLLAGVSLAVAAIPEGLPAVVTVVLAIGVQRMAKIRGVIRHLPAVETLGCTTFICSDKTGTLTTGSMALRGMWLDGRHYDYPAGGGRGAVPAAGPGASSAAGPRAIPGAGFRAVPAAGPRGVPAAGPRGVPAAGPLAGRSGAWGTAAAPPAAPSAAPPGAEKAFPGGSAPGGLPPLPREIPPGLRLLTLAGIICNNAEAGASPGEYTGAPTDVGLLQAARESGLRAASIRRRCPRRAEIPFDSRRKRMTVLFDDDAAGAEPHPAVATKGAPEVILDLCDRWYSGGRILPLGRFQRRQAAAAAARMAEGALRVLAVAWRPAAPEEAGRDLEEMEHSLIFLGLVGLADPPRPEAAPALARCRRAGIRVQMITGDHLVTAVAVARELGLVDGMPRTLEGRQIDAMSDGELGEVVEGVHVFARVAPEHKLRIVRALKQRGHVVAMTGDGVNDAPAVKEAHIGVAMGITGTAVTQEAASMILMDDNFATIVNTVEQGRAIYDNIRKFVRYLLASNLGEILVMFLGILAGLPLPLLPVHILFVNLVTDGLPAVALGLEPPEQGLMDQPPRPPRESIFSRGLGARIVTWGFVIGGVALGVFVWTLKETGSIGYARTAALASLVVSQMIHVLDCRSERKPLFHPGRRANAALSLSILSTLVLLGAIIYVPALQTAFRTVPLEPGHWGLIWGSSAAWGAAVALYRLVRGRGGYLAPAARVQ